MFRIAILNDIFILQDGRTDQPIGKISFRDSRNNTIGQDMGLLDANVYATKKTIAQGMLDVALLTANASQLKYLLQLGKAQQFFYLVSVDHWFYDRVAHEDEFSHRWLPWSAHQLFCR